MMKALFNTTTVYGSLSKFFHWVVAFLVILMLAFTYFISDLHDKNLQGTIFNAHKLIGLTILSLVVLRLIWTLMNPKPALPANTKAWERWAERAVHYLLYFALFLMPIAGWIGVSAGGHPPRLGSLSLGLPLAKSEWLDDLAFSVHNTLAIVLIVLVSIHILAAVYHLIVRKDQIFQRMLP